VTSLIPSDRIERSILLIRGHKVMLDADLARLYGVPTKVLNQAVKRNKNRFPPDFMFQLTEAEKDEVVTVCDHLRRTKDRVYCQRTGGEVRKAGSPADVTSEVPSLKSSYLHVTNRSRLRICHFSCCLLGSFALFCAPIVSAGLAESVTSLN
jgi:hypothetical protein